VINQRTQLDLNEEFSKLKFDWAADDAEAMRDFKSGIRLLRDKSYAGALAYFRRAHELERNNPYFLSYFGLSLALAERKWADAERLCESALPLKRNQAQLYLNLAEVCLLAGKRRDAVETLEVGLQHASRDVRLRRMSESLGVRTQSVLSFLDRRHPLNRALGRIRHGFHKLLSPR
jgi:tetratricopeptide (TPR) repeat protein